jgi:hypothetical protein
MLRHLALVFVIAALVSASPDLDVDKDDFDYDVAYETDFVQTSPMTELMDAVKTLRKHAPSHMSFHVNRVAKHAALIQSGDWGLTSKAKAYKHNFAASKAAIKSALAGLTNQLTTGHNHDKTALNSGLNAGKNAISAATSTGRDKTAGYKHKACPTKRHEVEADKKKRDAKSAMQAIQTTKMCSSGVSETWKDMDVDKSSPKFGTQLRNQWDKARSDWLKAKAKYDAAVKAHKDAQTRHNLAMASFKTACKLEAENAHTACKNAHAEYATLKKEVAGNVDMRKQVYIATLIVTCYVDNLTGNSAAKACADKQRSANTSRWNIAATNLPACVSATRLRDQFGPESWRPTSGNCGGHWTKALPSAGGPGTYNGNNCPSGYTQYNKQYCGHRYNGTKHKRNGEKPVVEKLATACSADKNCKAFDMAYSDNRYGHMCKAPFKKTAYHLYKLCVKKAVEEDMSLVESIANDMTMP